MKSLLVFFISMITVLFPGAMLCNAKIYNVSTASGLQSALDSAIAGDEIIVSNGTYNGRFDIDHNSGTAEQPITVRAANQHGAIFVGQNQCSKSEIAFKIERKHWTIKDLEIKYYGRPIYISSDGNYSEISDCIIHSFRTDGIYSNASYCKFNRNVMAFGDFCDGDTAIYLVTNADNNQVVDNIIYGMTDNGYQYGSKRGYNILIANNSDENLVKGNLTMGGGKGNFRILAGSKQSSADRNIVRDNEFLFGEGGISTGDCADDSNEFINNIMYGNYFWNLSTKGNLDGTKGHHKFEHNLLFMTNFSRGGVGFITGGEPFCPNPVVGYKIDNIVRDNIFYSSRPQNGFHNLLWVDSEADTIHQADHNLFWAPGSPSVWTVGYSFRAADISDDKSKPVFNDPANGDFSLTPSSPGKNAASSGKDIGAEYNVFLKKRWLTNAFSLETQQKEGLGTSISFTVSPSHWYQAWFYIPTSPCSESPETYTIEGKQVQRDIRGLTTGSIWVQPGGPARWITLGRHKADDGTLNISWTTNSCAEKIFIRRLPNPGEAYQWIAQHYQDIDNPNPPKGLRLATKDY